MSITRRPWKITHTLAPDGVTLESTEVIYYVAPAADADNPDLVMAEQQQSAVIDHSQSAATKSGDGVRGRAQAGDLTATQKTGIQTGITNTLNALDRVVPLNPGP